VAAGGGESKAKIQASLIQKSDIA